MKVEVKTSEPMNAIARRRKSRSADWQSAVSQNGILRGPGCFIGIKFLKRLSIAVEQLALSRPTGEEESHSTREYASP
jgi:hypothetical protein